MLQIHIIFFCQIEHLGNIFFLLDKSRKENVLESEERKRDVSDNEAMPISKKKRPNEPGTSNDETLVCDGVANPEAAEGGSVLGQNMKIVQAICIVCHIPIPNLFDVMYEGIAESELVSHKCETCATPVETKMEFIFPGWYFIMKFDKLTHFSWFF